MKFLLLKTLLLRKRRDEGFTLPMVMAIGLVMVLLSAVNLVQSGEENLMAISQEGSSDALAAAELGVSRYRDFLNRNRVLAVNNLDQWVGLDNETCDAISQDGQGWANNDNDGASSEYNEAMWREIQVDETLVGADLNNDDDTTDSNAEIGRYKIVDYIYDNDGDNTIDNNGELDLLNDANNNDDTPPIGILTVQGRDRIGSVAQLQVTIPLGVNTQDLEDLNPAIWIRQNDNTAPHINNFGSNVDVNGANVVLSRPSGSGYCDDPSNLNSNNTISDSRELPPIINQATIDTLTSRSLNSNLDQNTGSGINFFDSTPGIKKIILGTTLDDSGTDPALHTDGYYYYSTGASGLTLDAEEAIIADGNSKVILHIGGNLVINTGTSGNKIRIVNSTHRTEHDPDATIDEINDLTPSDIARYLEIHVEGDVTINGGGELFLTGLLRVGGTLKITGSSSTHIIGAVWANEWNNNGNGTVNVNIDNDDYKFYSITPNRTPEPVTYRPSEWERQEANQF